MNVAIFVRVSKKSQEYERQILELQEYADSKKYKVVEVISEKVTGSKKNVDRQGIVTLLSLARSGGIKKVLVSQVTRLGRNSRETDRILEELTSLKVSVYTRHFNLETLDEKGNKSPLAGLIFGILKEIAAYDLEVLSYNIKSGQELARKKGKVIGRPAGVESDSEILSKYKKVVSLINSSHSIRNIAKLTGYSSPTIQKVKRAMSQPKSV
jgi:DNA invertase Pin-like site-specific DNA recombinase